MSEKGMHDTMKRVLGAYNPIRVENTCDPGTPDMNCTLGWVEYKWLRAWPREPEASVPFDKFRPAQRAWLAERCQSREADAWMMIQVSTGSRSEWLLLWGTDAAKHVGHASAQGLRAMARARWLGDNNIDGGELVACLRTRGQ